MNQLPRTKILFDDEVRAKVVTGIDILEKAVGQTLGPRSRAVGIDKGFMWKIHKDGVGVAKEIFLEDPFEDFGVKIVTESAQKTVDECGDGTTVTVILAHALIHECLKAISSGINPMSLRKGLEEGVAILIKRLDELAIPVKSYEQKLNIATISASGDKEIGGLIAKTLEEIGEDGVMTISESKNLETKVEKQDGMQIEHGYSHPYFINNIEKMAAVYENVPILVSNKNLTNTPEVMPFIQKISQVSKQLVIIAPEVAVDIIEVLLKHKIEGNFQSLVIKAPGVGENQRDILRDICAISGAKYISAEAGDKFDELTLDDLGKLDSIVSNKLSTIMVGNSGNVEKVNERIASIKAQMKQEDLTDFEKEKLKERLAKLTNGIAVLKIGGATEIEMRERKERAEDALGATQAAIREGIVPGGEVVYIYINNEPEGVVYDEIAWGILEKVLWYPFNRLLTNAGMNPAQYWNSIKDGMGIDVTDEQVTDLLKEGIIDPVLVPKVALRNSLSVALQIIQLGGVITQLQEEKKGV